MKNITSKVFIALFALGIIYIVYIVVRRFKVDSEIEQNGNYCIAVISKRTISKGSVGDLTFFFKYDGKKYKYTTSVEDEYFENHQIGDTIVIKTLSSKLPESIICENLSYKTCYGEQPVNGWIKLPVCK